MADIIIKRDVDRELTKEELDNNFTELEATMSVAPIFTGLASHYLEGDVNTITVSNFVSQALYLSNDELMVNNGDGTFDVRVSGDGFRLFCVEEGKRPMSFLWSIIEQYLVYGKSAFPTTYSNATLYTVGGEYYVIRNNDGLTNTMVYDAGMSSQYTVGIKPYILTHLQKETAFLPAESSTTEAYFFYTKDVPDFVTFKANNIYNDSNARDTDSMVQVTGNPDTLDFFGDGSCVDFWTFDNTLSNHDVTNNFDIAGSFTGGVFGMSAFHQTDTTIRTSVAPQPITGDVPCSVSFWMYHDSCYSEGDIGMKFSFGEQGQRYNYEVWCSTSSGINGVFASFHKGAIGTQLAPSGGGRGWKNIVMTYSAGSIKIYMNKVLMYSITYIMKWNGAMGYQLHDGGSGYYSCYLGRFAQLRVFDKELIQADVDALHAEGRWKMTLSPPLSFVPQEAYNGRLPNYAEISGTPFISMDATVKSYDATTKETVFEQGVADDPYYPVGAIPTMTVKNENTATAGLDIKQRLLVDVAIDKNT